MTHLPLISHAHPDAVIARHRGTPIVAARFVADVRAVAAALPAGSHILNACSDRYAFAVTLAAAMLDHRITLLPSTYTSEAVGRLKEFAPDAFCVTDTDANDMPLPTVAYPIALPWQSPEPTETAAHTDTPPFEVPLIHADRIVAYVFTSGSTGVPVPHPKTWGRLVRSVQVARAALGLDAAHPSGQNRTLIGTVPPQHMFGFESTILLALIGGQSFDTGRPFYPADIVESLERVPAPRVLVTTPVHLRSLLLGLDAHAPLPTLELTLCATAPLSTTLAADTEQRFAGPLKEIYGSTETGQIATRRTATDDSWLLMPDVRLEWLNGQAWASDGHIETPTPLGDLLEPRGEPDPERGIERFALTGRTADLVNIAGKRTSIGYLNHQIASIEGVVDAGFYMPDDERPGMVTRLAAFAVAPGLTVSAVMAALRERIEPAFLPRPLVLVDTLARNETGKLARATLKDLYDQHAAAHRDATDRQASALPVAQPVGQPIALPIAADHPAYAGHFPGHPVLPGVVLIDAALAAIADQTGHALSTRELASAKFLSPVMPGEALTLERRTTDSGAIEFTIHAGERMVARGTLTA